MKNETIRKMQEIRLSAMAEAFEIQLQQPERFEQLSFEERLAFLVDHEYDIRRNNQASPSNDLQKVRACRNGH